MPQPDNHPSKSHFAPGTGITLGISLGVAFDNIGVGVALGTAIGVAIDASSRPRTCHTDAPDKKPPHKRDD